MPFPGGAALTDGPFYFFFPPSLPSDRRSPHFAGHVQRNVSSSDVPVFNSDCVCLTPPACANRFSSFSLYSPVYEFLVAGEIVMRRRVDDWLNATQFLKVAAFDKPQRTRILEREVQKGVHEKIQGGYGKSQGTWVPFDRGVALARQYKIEHLIRPLLEVDKDAGSPPPAPKHVVAPPTKRKKTDGGGAGGAGSSARSTPLRAQQLQQQQQQGAGAGAAANVTGGYVVQQAGAPPPAAATSGGGGGAYGGGLAPAVDIGPYNMHPMVPMRVVPQQQQQGRRVMAPAAQAGRMADDSFDDAPSSSSNPSDVSSSSRTPSPMPHLNHPHGGQQQQQPQQQQYPSQQHTHGSGGYGSMNDHVGIGGGVYTPTNADTSADSLPGFSGGGGGFASSGHLKRKAGGGGDGMEDYDLVAGGPSSSSSRRQPKFDASSPIGGGALVGVGPAGDGVGGGAAPYGLVIPPETYGNIILDYFITEKARIPDFLVEPPADFDPNVVIDDDGHTALHWACAMGRLRVVKLLLTAGADIFKVNHAEQTALMRSVMFSNNYDVRKFPELYQLLHRSTLNIDKANRTVFHHIADVALTKGKTHAARYYMETILHHLEDFPQELEDVINFQDEEGETALTLAARARSKRLVRALLDHGADPKIANRDNKTAEDYILEDERFRSSPALNAKLALAGDNSVVAVSGKFAHQLYHSQAAQATAGRATADVATMLDDLAQAFDSELQQKERDIIQAEGLLVSLRAEIADAKKELEALGNAASPTSKEKMAQEQRKIEVDLENAMNRRHRAGWQAWLASQQEKQARWESQGRPETEEFADVKARVEAGGDIASLRQQVEAGERDRVAMFKQYISEKAEVSPRRLLLSMLSLMPLQLCRRMPQANNSATTKS